MDGVTRIGPSARAEADPALPTAAIPAARSARTSGERAAEALAQLARAGILMTTAVSGIAGGGAGAPTPLAKSHWWFIRHGSSQNAAP